MNIPFSPPYINNDTEKEVLEVLRSGWITTGPRVKMLENWLMSQYQIPKVVACNSGTSALLLALNWLGVGPGDEVIIPAYTYAATALAVWHRGARPVMVDSAGDFNIDIDKLSAAISSRTKAIIPVDIGGWPADYKALYKLENMQFAPDNDRQARLGRPLLLADAAHSLGAVADGEKSGRLADFTAFSFHAVKNVTTAEGGAICLNLPADFDVEEEAGQIRLCTLNGQTKDALSKSKNGDWQYDIVCAGYKMNMPDVLAAIGLSQLKLYEEELLPIRKTLFRTYQERFSPFDWAQLPEWHKQGKISSCHLYMLRIRGVSEEQRNRIINLITQAGVSVNVHFIPLPMLSFFRQAGYKISDYPVAYDNYSREISLPLYPQLTLEQVNYVADIVIASVEKVL